MYSHIRYDIVEGERRVVNQPDILIVEGLNVLQTGVARAGTPQVFVSDFFDLSIFVDADESHVRTWYRDRFRTLRETAFRDDRSYFRRYAELTDDEADATADDIWDRINGPNLRMNVVPSRSRADVILRKGPDHVVERVQLRKL